MFNFGFGGIPGGMHGHGGHGGSGRAAAARQEVDNTKFYQLLGVDKNASESEIKKGFRKQAMQHHPDKGGDSEKFKEISKAYEVLSDPEKKTLYDEMGEEGLDGSGGGSGGPMDIFDLFGGGMFGGGGGAARQQRGPRKGEDVVFPLKVTLEDLYNGTSKKLRLTKNVICPGCNGKGGKTESTCKGCKGQGIRLVIRQLGPGMIQQSQAMCNECSGTGSSIPEKDKCKKCNAEKTVKEKKTLEVFIDRGSKHGDKIPFRGEADEAPETIPGDVIVVLQQLEHEKFKRKGLHLIMRKEITLVEALTGFVFYIQHMDNRVLKVTSERDVVYRPDTIKCIKNEGMPQPKNPYIRGDLIIEFKIKFPESGELNEAAKKAIKSALPAPAAEPIPVPKRSPIDMADDETGDNINSNAVPEIEEKELHDFDLHATNASDREEQQREAYEEDEEGHGHGRPGCRAQ